MVVELILGGVSATLGIVVIAQHYSSKKLAVGFASLKQGVEALTLQKTELQRKSEHLSDEVTQQQAKSLRLVTDLQGYERQKNQLETQIQSLAARRAELETLAKVASGDNVAASQEKTKTLAQLATTQAELSRALEELRVTTQRCSHVVELDGRRDELESHLQKLADSLVQNQIQFEAQRNSNQTCLNDLAARIERSSSQLHELMGRLDLYSRIADFCQAGHFEEPAYLWQTSERYAAEIKVLRNKQRELIKSGQAITYPDNAPASKKILDGQTALMLSAFNVECDLLIEKVNPGNLDRTLEQIERRAEQLEKNAATLLCGFNTIYVRLKYEECRLQYEFRLNKQREQEEQRIIREQMREEARAQKQYEDAVRDAEKEEAKFERLLEKAREQLDKASETQRAEALARIAVLEAELEAAHDKGERAKSMAEQTRRGFVYVISNIGAFGEGVYKIGLTRRLDPQERVDELGDASVPFPFDVHAMCYSEDAPALENALHRKFSHRRVNAVNLRKEFFRVELDDVRQAISEMVGSDVDFRVTAQAEAFYESRRLMG